MKPISSSFCAKPKSYRDGRAFDGLRLVLLLGLLFAFAKGRGQQGGGYEELVIRLEVPQVGDTEIPALINDDQAYLQVAGLFDYLKLKNTATTGLDSLTGFFMSPQNPFVIDKTHGRITFNGKKMDLSPADLIRTESGLFLKAALFGPVFGLDCQFRFRDLAVTLNTQLELPALREKKQELLRKNLSQLKGEKKADTVIKREFSFFHLGVADWSVTATQASSGKPYVMANLSIGASILGGEAQASLNYMGGKTLNGRQQFYSWRYVNNDLTAVKQIKLGRIAPQSIASVFAPVNGIQLTNTPTTNRRSFGTYRYTGNTNPDWMVELYVNNVLINYVKADATGFYSFEIPLVYGNSSIQLKFLGPWGEERVKEENISIPFNFIPERQLEYTISAGVVNDGSNSRFSRANLNYGLHRRVTLGGGLEYLSSVMQGRPMPFLSTSVRLFSGLILNGEYTHGVRTRGIANYRLPANLQLDLSYTKYKSGQTAIWYGYLEERKASVSMPVRLSRFRAFSRISFNQYVLPKIKYSNTEWLLSANVRGVNYNLRTLVQFSEVMRTTAYSHLSLAYWLPYGIRVSPQIQYQIDRNRVTMIKGEVEKRITDRGFLNLSYENNTALHSSYFTVGLRYNFSFAQTFLSTRMGKGSRTTTQSARGSLLADPKTHYLAFSTQAGVGRGGLIVLPFLDINCNGRRDANEPRAYGLQLSTSGGHVQRNDRDTTLQITGLEAYTKCLIELDQNSFDNVAWKISKPTLQVSVEPNRFRIIEVPVMVVGEASGMVYLRRGKQQKGLSRMLVNFFDSSAQKVAHTLTEEDGYFSFLGLKPGNYTARVDTAQLNALHLVSLTPDLSFTIAGSEEGTVASGFELVLKSLVDTLPLPEDTLVANTGTSVGERDRTRQDTPTAVKEHSGKPVLKSRAATGDTLQQKHQKQQEANRYAKPLAGAKQKAGARPPAKQISQGRQVQNAAVKVHPRQPVQKGITAKQDSLHNSQKQSNKAHTATPLGRGRQTVQNNMNKAPQQGNGVARQGTSTYKLSGGKLQPAPNHKQVIAGRYQRLGSRQAAVMQQLQKLLEEQRVLIEQQKMLIREIKRLKQLQLLRRGK